jgi:hypothetical protein
VISPVIPNDAGSIAGTVFDSAMGRPIEGAKIGAQMTEPHDSRGARYGDAISDTRGRFRIGGLRSGVYNLLLLDSPKGKRFTAKAIEGLRVKADIETQADISMSEGRWLRGAVADASTKAPLAGVMVGYYGAARPQSGAAIITSRTDEGGHFEFYLPPGSAYVYLADIRYTGPSSRQTLTVPVNKDPNPIRFEVTPTPEGRRMMGAGGEAPTKTKVERPTPRKADGSTP